MDSWTLQGDSYSFLRSAPRTFSLCHRDGTPNHVEIFDIINVPTQRNAISETTCLCDIFGDDGESPSLSSSPAVGAIVPSPREVEGTAAASPPVDDLNDSSGSYHTAHGSSEGEEGFEDSGERVYSPPLQGEPSERRLSESKWLSSGQPEVPENSNPNLEPKSKSPVPQLSTSSPSSQVLNSGERTPSPGHNSPYTLSPEGRLSSLSSSSAEKSRSPSSPDPKQAHLEAEPKGITPSFLDRPNSRSNQSLSPSPSLELRNRVSSSESVNTQFLPESQIAEDLPEPRANHLNQNISPSPENFPQDFTESNFESRAVLSSPLHSPSADSLSESRETPVSPELSSSFTDTQASSPFSELRGRVSLPDLFSRGSTPEITDCPHTPELISDLSTTERDTATTPESQDTRLSLEPDGAVSPSAPRYTPPSPVISTAASPGLVESTASPELRNTGPSPGLLCPVSPTRTGSRTPSPDPSAKIRRNSTFSETKTQDPSPVVTYSLSPSPGIRESCSPIEHRHTAPSPEIRITASSPEVSRKERSPEVETTSASPFLEPHFESASSRNLSSSPHITGISYSVVQPEDRDSPPFPELSRLSTPEPDRTRMSSEARSLTPSRESIGSSIAESTGTPRDSPHISGFTNFVSESELTHQVGFQTPSPQPDHHTPSPELRYQSLSPDKYHSPSPQQRSRDPSPVASIPEQRYQHSPATLCTEYNPQYTQPAPPDRNTPEVERNSCSVDVTGAQSPTHLEKHSVSPSFESDRRDESLVAEIKSSSPVVTGYSPVSKSPVVTEEEKVDSSLKHQSTEREETSKESSSQHKSTVVSFSDETQDIYHPFYQREDTSHNPASETKSPSPNLIVSKDKSPNISPVHTATSNSPVQRLQNPQPQFTSCSSTSESSSSLKSTSTAANSRRQLLTKVRRENRERFTEDMSRRVNRRRTPSPPLTRFTPVHIIAPEKPYRQWQNRSRSPSQVVASSPSGNLKNAVTNRESPDVAPVDNNSQAHWVRQGRQLEMGREMQLEQEREVGRDRQMDREVKRERKREERERGEGWQGDASYRGEQVELSFSARNRKGPASRSAAPTSRETRQGLPTVHSYSESLLATRQLQQQQSLFRLASQQDARGGSTGRRLQPPAPQKKSSAPGRVATNRPCRSSSSSMGSELDEADNEESPAGVNAAWPAYADFRGSAPKLDHDELSFQHPYAYYTDGLDPSRRYELGSFECVDVAVEREDSRKVRRGVPKRQIQLKRKSNAEGKQDESSENSSPGLPVMGESPSQESPPRGTFLRQHSTPAAIQDCYPSEHSPEPVQQNERKSKLQKSASMDETCTKTKMATCLIKSVLSKKMQSVDKHPDEQIGEETRPSFEEISPPTESVVASLKESPKPDAHNLSSSLQSDYSLSSEGLSVRGEASTKDEAKPPKSFGMRSSNRPGSSSSSRSVNFSLTDSEEADSQSRTAPSLRSEMKSELKVPFDSKQTGAQRADESKTHEREAGDSSNATAGNTGAPSATGANNTQVRMTNRDQECENTEDHKQVQQGDKSAYMSKSQEITLKSVEKKKASLNVCLTPEAENKPEAPSPEMSFREKEEKIEVSAEEKTEEDGNENNKVKAPIHKVRDVRRLVKNTYNLSFKATSAAMPSNVNEERMDTFNEERREEVTAGEEREVRHEIRREEKMEETEEEFWVERKEEQKEEVKDSKSQTFSPPPQSKGKSPSGPQPMQIEYKAVCWKEDKNKMSGIKKESEKPGDKPQASSKPVTEPSRESLNANTANSTRGETVTVRTCEHDVNITAETQETTTEIHKVSDTEDKPALVRTDRKPPMLGSLPKMHSKEREVSTAVVLIREGSSKTKTSASPAQEDIHSAIQAPPASLSPGPPGSGGHSVSMLLKEKGYQADIGAVVGDNQNTAGGKGVPHKHVNCLEIPLQTITPPDSGRTESQRERTFSSSSTTSGPSAVTDSTDALTKTREDEGVGIKPAGKDAAKQKSFSPLRNTQEQTPALTKQKDPGDFEAVKRMDPTFPPRSPAIRRFKPQPIEVKSLSKEPQKQEMSTNSTGTNRPQTIEVKSIAKNSQKPAVPPKPSCKFKPADLGAAPNEAQRSSTVTAKPQGEERSQTIVVSSPTIYRKISNESTSASNYSRKLAVSTVSSLKPPSNKTTATTISSLSNQSTEQSETEATDDRAQQQQPTASPQSSRYVQKPITAPTSAPGSGVTSAPSHVPDPKPSQISGPASARVTQPSQPAAVDPDSQLQCPRPAYPHEQAMPVTSNHAKQPAAVSTTQAPRYTHQPCRRSLSSERSHRTDDLRFYASDDPPSYDERESFSPLLLPDLTPLRSNRFQPASRAPPCSCSAGCPSHPGLTPPHHHRSPHNLTPPAPPHSPGQTLPYPVAQPALRPHQCRPEPQPMSYQPSSPKSNTLGPSQPPSMYQPLHQPAPCPPHPSLMQACSADRPLQPPQHIDPRRPPVHRSPHQQPPGMAGAPYSDTSHSHSPGLPPMDPQYLCGPQGMGPSYGSEYGGDSVYSESSYGQTPRRVLMDPETGKYFYIEVPVQPLRKMLFDPETGQYVEVLIPQQAMSHSGLYPPSAAPYPPLHNPNMYAPAPQYMPYAAPPPPAHPQSQSQPPRYPEASAAATMHPSGPGVSYRNPSGQGSKPEPPNHPPLDHSYLESMYYVPTGMNASPNPTPPDYYHKHPPNLPPAGGKRS
ncbi:nascent polypeptide-associated complex subunit alpha, muscle-specific form isoform X2 [Stegastes partitus]|uniref:Nascent polypeptide-associated complex subunit alpha, muscle-specific form isoform X2 n=1 Tax=Stegastes partitus TaxID=144197 RepID=A0A9Y4NBD5_9TELE|nr:PREDICTED: nascent polypeptide-associated complex subunit alpha, muscle-specific form-like isoform X2 [Stegastes partitus]